MSAGERTEALAADDTEARHLYGRGTGGFATHDTKRPARRGIGRDDTDL
jgi:hypothetical protein